MTPERVKQSKASRAREKPNRQEGPNPEKPKSEMIKTMGESRRAVPRDIITARQVFNPEGAMEDAIDLIEWAE